MKVLKFGGTSVGSAERIKNVAKLIVEDGQPKFVVLSAMSGTTNTLLEISGYYRLQNAVGASEVIVRLEQKYKEVIEALYTNDDLKKEAKCVMKGIFEYIRSFANRPFTIYEEKCIVAQGELLSTNLMNLYLKQEGVKVGFMQALDFMRIDKNAAAVITGIAARDNAAVHIERTDHVGNVNGAAVIVDVAGEGTTVHIEDAFLYVYAAAVSVVAV